MAPDKKFQQQVLKTLDHLDNDIEFLKKRVNLLAMYVEDSTLTDEERKLLDEAHADKKAGKLVPLEEVRKKLGI